MRGINSTSKNVSIRKVVEPESSCVLLSWCQTHPQLIFSHFPSLILQVDLSHWSSPYFFIVFFLLFHILVHIFLGLLRLKVGLMQKILFLDQYKGSAGTRGRVSWKVKRPGGILGWAWPLFLYSWVDDVINSAGGFQLSPSDQGKPRGCHGNGGGDTQIRPFDIQVMMPDEGKCHFFLPLNHCF